MSPQKKATVVSSLVATFLTLIKFSIGIVSGSVALLASAVDSILDLFVSLFNYFAIRNSEKPADTVFNYGRGKIEALACVIEGTVIFLSGLYLLYHAGSKFFHPTTLHYIDIALYVMVASFIITLALVLYLNTVAKQTNSMVIKADALHYKTDLYTNGAVLFSLLVIQLSGYTLIDAVIGTLISLYILYSAYSLTKEGIFILLDHSVDQDVVTKIQTIIENNPNVNTYHLLKTREAGYQTFVDVHLVFDCLITLMEAHRTSDAIENKIKAIDSNRDWIISIHLDPYDDSDMNNEH